VIYRRQSEMGISCIPRAGVFLLIGIAAGLSSAAFAAQAGCTRQEAIRAESEADSLRTWGQVFGSYQRYRQCDDGAIAEGYSASIAALLADRWDHVKELIALINAHPQFEAFVLRHVDVTMSLDQSKAIQENVQARCPRAGERLCAAVGKALAQAH
jgi:hypothetical protein